MGTARAAVRRVAVPVPAVFRTLSGLGSPLRWAWQPVQLPVRDSLWRLWTGARGAQPLSVRSLGPLSTTATAALLRWELRSLLTLKPIGPRADSTTSVSDASSRGERTWCESARRESTRRKSASTRRTCSRAARRSCVAPVVYRRNRSRPKAVNGYRLPIG